MKKKQAEESLARKNFRKKMIKTLSVTMAVSMVAGQPMAVLADSTEDPNKTVVVSDTAESATETDSEEKEKETTEAVSEEKEKETTEAVSEEKEKETTEAVSEEKEETTETVEEAALFSEEVPDPEASVFQLESEEDAVLPMTKMPELENGKKYTVPFRMYKADSVKEGKDGILRADTSMGEFCLESNIADLYMDGNGKVRIKIHLLADSACTGLNYFESEKDYRTYTESEENYKKEIQALKKGGTPLSPSDDVIYTYEATDTYYPCDEAITSVTFTAPSTDSLIYFCVRAMGMNNGMSDQFGVFGFDYTQLKEAEKPEYAKTLDAKIKECKDLKNEDGTYTIASFHDLTEAIKNAELTAAKEGLEKEEAEAAVSALTKAKEGLVVLTGLKAVIDEADAKVKQEDAYTGASRDLLKAESDFAKMIYYQEKNTQKTIDDEIESLKAVMGKLVPVSGDQLNKNALKDGVYKVEVNLWHATQNKVSMGNDALDHTAVLTVKDGTYTLRLNGFPMTVGKQKGELDSLRLIANGDQPEKDDSNYKEAEITREGDQYHIDLELKNTDDLTEYYYAGIKVHTINEKGETGYPMGKNWIDNRLRISWESLSLEKLFLDTTELENALTEAKTVKNEDNRYSAGSYEKLTQAIAAGEALLSSQDLTDEKLADAVKKIKDAKDGLVDLTDLRNAVAKAEETDQSKYTEASLARFDQALKTAKNDLSNAKVSKKAAANDIETLKEAEKELVKISTENLDKNNLEDGIYTVGVNLWNEGSDSPSMGDAALYHTAKLEVKDGVYTLKLKGHEMNVMGLTGGLDGLRIIPDGAEPADDESNYVEKEVKKEGTDYLVDIELTNPKKVSEYYFGGIKIHAINKDGELTYPMGQKWIGSRLRISWNSLTLDQLMVDTGELEAALAEAKTVKNEDNRYSAGSYEKLTQAIAAGEALLTSKDLTKTKVENAVKELNEKTEKLVEIRDLKTVIDKAEALAAETEKYTAATISALKESIKTAKTSYYEENVTQKNVDDAKSMLENSIGNLMEISNEKLDKNKLEDGVYTVSVNLWHVDQDKESMGNDALYHTATLTVQDGKYALQLRGHQMTVGTQTGELDAIRIVPDGTEPKGDGSNYKELKIRKDGADYFIDLELENPSDVTEYYYGGIKVHTVTPDGKIGYPMGENWISNRLRISWESLALKESADKYPAFTATDPATGITVSAPEGALPKGTQMEAVKITDPAKLESIEKTLSNLAERSMPYEISLFLWKDGKKEIVEPKNGMELTVVLPVPEGYQDEKVTCYYLDENNYANPLAGTLKDGKYTVANSKIGIYAISEKKGKAPTYVVDPSGQNKTTGSKTGSTPAAVSQSVKSQGATSPAATSKAGKVKTADTANAAAPLTAMMAAFTAAAGAFFFRKKRRVPENDGSERRM